VCDALKIPQISTGDILRRAIKEQTPTGLKAKSFIDAGKLVPDEVVIDIVKERLAQDDCKAGYILDGFPRTVPQAEALEQFAKIDSVFELAVEDEKLIKRISGRRVCTKCGATYHISLLGDKTTCANCGEPLIQRNDDKAETVLNRLTVYHSQTAPLVSFYEGKGLLKKVDGDGDMDAIFGKIMEALGQA
jgi:adenylate kinase